MTRRETILSMFDATGFGLEIGPSYNPLLPKSEGYKVETIDYTDQAGLIAKYANDATVDTSRIEPLDYVSDGRSPAEIIGETARYDFIVASHVIEHVPDLIEFLNSCERLLKPGGSLVLAVPDKRCCFDLYQPLTTVGEVLETHRLRRTRPGYASVFDEVAYGVTQDGSSGWLLAHDGERAFHQTLSNAVAMAEAADSGSYIDVHVWRFVPASFELVMGDLRDIGAIGLGIAELRASGELLVVMSASAPKSSRTRLELMDAALVELAQGVPGARSRASTDSSILFRLQRELDDARAALDSQGLENGRLRSDMSQLLSSRSWRYTKPLRACLSLLKG